MTSVSEFVLPAPTPEERAAAERRGIEAHEQFRENIGKTYQNAFRYMDGSPANRKKCTKCKGIKNLGDFYRDLRSKDGRVYQCKKCLRAQHQEYYRRKKK